MIKTSFRKFDGKRYKRLPSGDLKSEAKSVAKVMRRRGWNARVLKYPRGYRVYGRKKTSKKRRRKR